MVTDNGSRLKILVLGPPLILVGDTPIEIKRRVVRALLFYLACASAPVPRSTLTLLFWPDESEENARRHLRENLGKLRADLPNPDVIRTKQDQITLDPQAVYCDLKDFNNRLQSAGPVSRSLPGLLLPEAVRASLMEAVQLWRSPRFLDGASLPMVSELENWVTDMGAETETNRKHLLERLADDAMERGDGETAINMLRRVLQVDEWNTNIHYRLVSAMRSLGRNKEILDHCRNLEESLRTENLGDIPPAFVQLCQEIEQELFQPAPSNRTIWPLTRGLQSPFVGRQKELEQLHQIYTRGGMVIIEGEAGSGKTRLIHQFFQRLEPPPRLLMAINRPFEDNLPFQPWVDLLRHNITTEEWRLLAPEWVQMLARLLPELLETLNKKIVSEHTPPESNPTHLFEAIYQLLSILSARQKLLFVFDDAQWSDESSLQVLAYLLGRNFFAQRGLLVIACRGEEITPRLESILVQPGANNPDRKIILEELRPEDLQDLARSVLGTTPHPNLIERLSIDTGGNPLFVLETLRALTEFSLDPNLLASMHRLPVASSMHNLLQQRLMLLNPTTRQVISIAAVLGSQFTPAVLEAASKLPPETVVEALEKLEKTHLIRSTTIPYPSYVFIHDKFREELLMGLTLARKRLLHLNAAQGLVKASSSMREQAAVIANHFQEAGDTFTAFAYWMLAAERATEMLARSEAYTAYKNAGQCLLTVEGDIEDAMVNRYFNGWADLASQTNDFPTMLSCYNQLQQVGKRRSSNRLLGNSFSGLAFTAMNQGLFPQAERLITHALEYLERSKDLTGLATAYERAGMIQMLQMNNKDAIGWLEKTIAATKEDPSPASSEIRRETETRLGMVYILNGWPLKGEVLAAQALEDGYHSLSPTAIMNGEIILSSAHFCSGRHITARQHAISGLQVADRSMWYLRALLLVSVGRAALSMGNLDEAVDCLNSAIQMGEDYSFPDAIAEAQTVMGDVYWVLGAASEARNLYLKAFQFSPDSFQGLESRFRYGYTLYN
ncbi:MAG TPA: AAA family ATPase, partial [Longilinea sp.]|nr:AAA family ATPase [Longilinea sp.]